MPSKRINHPRKTNRGSYTAEKMRNAIDRVTKGEKIRPVALEFGLAFKTLARLT